MINRKTAVLLLASHLALTACQPHGAPTATSLETLKDELSPASSDGGLIYLGVRDAIDRVIIVARDTSTTSESTTSTTETTTSSTSTSTTSSETTSTSTTTSSSTSTSSTSSTSTTSTATTSSTSSTSTQSTTSSTSTTSSSSTTTTSSSTTTSTASATSTTSAEIAEWNRKGNIAAIIFSCCLVSLFSGVSILHCAKDRAKSKRIAARELLKAKSIAAESLVASRGGSTAELIPDRSSMMFKDNPFGDQRPQTAYSGAGSANNGWATTSPAQQQASMESSTAANGTSNGDHHRGGFV
ncbi:uncharacterized protein N7496_005767 [Penicillium cataractarum]|uniref:Uncharacterized protein n=1 Tax=Penicillium cataractarum TaxID=2100454 RepID=A0A9W9S1N2_9EURO|nr:uncharacterized protein N7496_005767 [Penicillium cataractarum]KAJ5369675.1 hypothetical protein N7496_005767 [Penicillium cataractarum]